MAVPAAIATDYSTIRVTPTTGGIGAEIPDVDLRELTDELICDLKQAWLDYKVLFFRNQQLTKKQHISYGQALGELEIHPFTPNDDTHPELIVLHSTPDRFFAAQTWHSDVTFRKCPPLGSILYGRIIPQWGGDTCFANMELAYALLPDHIKQQVEDLNAVHSMAKTFALRMSESERESAFEKYPDQLHPVVRTHPETGRKSLYVNINFTMRFEGQTEEESAKLLEILYEQAKKPELQCRFHWAPGSIAQWDNRCSQHYAVPDYEGCERRVERVTLVGDKPF